MVFYHKKAVRVQANHQDVTRFHILWKTQDPAMSSLFKPQLFTEGEGPIKSPTMPYMAETSVVSFNKSPM